MADAYLGEIRLFPFNYAPAGWHICDGTILPIQNYQGLFSLISNKYGGDGQKTFALPDLRGRVPISLAQNRPIAANGGVETVTLTLDQIPAHTHAMAAYNGTANAAEPNDVLAEPKLLNIYCPTANTPATLYSNSVENFGGSQAHNNMQPSLTLNYCIVISGYYPPRP